MSVISELPQVCEVVTDVCFDNDIHSGGYFPKLRMAGRTIQIQ